MNDHSPKFDKVKTYYDDGHWTADMVRNAAHNPPASPWITEAEVDKILGTTTQAQTVTGGIDMKPVK